MYLCHFFFILQTIFWQTKLLTRGTLSWGAINPHFATGEFFKWSASRKGSYRIIIISHVVVYPLWWLYSCQLNHARWWVGGTNVSFHFHSSIIIIHILSNSCQTLWPKDKFVLHCQKKKKKRAINNNTFIFLFWGNKTHFLWFRSIRIYRWEQLRSKRNYRLKQSCW